ncbi:glycosyltransferase [uncultured Alcanivorax sp.]|uniref:glycosyltransferase n=1 Tax=uncultured Alcanivorax sp. TaxID=191215 RepID=UPI002617D4CB|nr:glycosyltransferase [uncultured Alcanivorax sp.]
MRILFVSAIDFKEKSIQVIRKTPEYYARKGAGVDYVVARDNLLTGNYFYEDEITPEGVDVHRVYWPFPKMRAYLPRYPSLILTKLASLLVVMKLILKFGLALKNNNYDVVYGYEIQGVIAVALMRKLGFVKNMKVVSRFQGSFLNEMIEGRQYARLAFNFDALIAMKCKCDLMILTDDGTKANQAVEKISPKAKYIFVPNGVDIPSENNLGECKLLAEKQEGVLTFVSVSRLVGWKRVDRCLDLFKEIIDSYGGEAEYWVLGDGEGRSELEERASNLGLRNRVKFLGAVKQSDVFGLLAQADVFLSMYDHSNVGNPLFEAMRLNKLIVTLDNGDTGLWIRHGFNGFIYNPNNLKFNKISGDVLAAISNAEKHANILHNLKLTADEKLWTWDERLLFEFNEVTQLLHG